MGKCDVCGAAMKALFSSVYCPNDCDRSPVARPPVARLYTNRALRTRTITLRDDANQGQVVIRGNAWVSAKGTVPAPPGAHPVPPSVCSCQAVIVPGWGPTKPRLRLSGSDWVCGDCGLPR